MGLRDRLMAPEAAEEAMRAYAEETNRLNRERRASGASDRRELAAIGKKIAAMISAIEDGGYVRGMSDRLRELEARQDELTALLAAVPADLPDIHPNVAAVYRRKVERLAEALKCPDERAEAADAIRGLIERIVLTPGEKWGEVHATLHGDLATILEWTGNGGEKGGNGTPGSGLSVSAKTGALFVHASTALGPRAGERGPGCAPKIGSERAFPILIRLAPPRRISPLRPHFRGGDRVGPFNRTHTGPIATSAGGGSGSPRSFPWFRRAPSARAGGTGNPPPGRR